MYEPRMTKPQAMAAARYLVRTFHQDMPDVDDVTADIITRQFGHELTAAVQHDVGADALYDMLETLDAERSLYYRTDEYMGLENDQAAIDAEQIFLSNAFDEDLKNAFNDYRAWPLHYFTNHNTTAHKAA